jgi:hypothetical protein
MANLVAVLIEFGLFIVPASLAYKGLFKGELPVTREKKLTGLPSRIVGFFCLALALCLAAVLLSGLQRLGK